MMSLAIYIVCGERDHSRSDSQILTSKIPYRCESSILPLGDKMNLVNAFYLKQLVFFACSSVSIHKCFSCDVCELCVQRRDLHLR